MPDPGSGEIGWYRPDPRAIIPLDGFHVSRSLRRTLKKNIFTTTSDRAFTDVMRACSARPDTWITEEFINTYTELYRRGFAHSIEVWQDDILVGGVYGVSINGAFFAESMFHRATDASKVALKFLVEHMKKQKMILLEVQFLTPHLKSLGAIEIADESYIDKLELALASKYGFIPRNDEKNINGENV